MNYCVKANRYHPPPPLPLLPLLFPLLFSFTNSLGTDAPYTSFLRSLISSECSGWPIISVKYSLHHIYFYASQNMLTWITDNILNTSVQISHSVLANSLWPHGLQDTRPPYPSPTPATCSNSCPSSRWCHPTISSSVIPSPPALNLSQHQRFLMSQLFAAGGQSIGVSPLASVLSINIQHWFPLGQTGLTSFQSKGLSRVLSNTTVQEHQFFDAQLSLWSNSHIHMTTGKTIA